MGQRRPPGDDLSLERTARRNRRRAVRRAHGPRPPGTAPGPGGRIMHRPPRRSQNHGHPQRVASSLKPQAHGWHSVGIAILRLCGPSAKALLEKLCAEPIPDLAELHHVARHIGSPPMLLRVRWQSCLAIAGYDLLCPAADAIRLRNALIGAGAIVAGP